MKNKSLSRQFEEESSENDKSEAPASPVSAPEYSFEGYTIAINEKIMLMPVQAAKQNNNG